MPPLSRAAPTRVRGPQDQRDADGGDDHPGQRQQREAARRTAGAASTAVAGGTRNSRLETPEALPRRSRNSSSSTAPIDSGTTSHTSAATKCAVHSIDRSSVAPATATSSEGRGGVLHGGARQQRDGVAVLLLPQRAAPSRTAAPRRQARPRPAAARRRRRRSRQPGREHEDDAADAEGQPQPLHAPQPLAEQPGGQRRGEHRLQAGHDRGHAGRQPGDARRRRRRGSRRAAAARRRRPGRLAAAAGHGDRRTAASTASSAPASASRRARKVNGSA